MKIYNIVSENKSKVWTGEDDKVLIPSKSIYKLEVNNEAIELLKNTGGNTSDQVKYLILNLWNCGQYPLDDVDLFGMMRNADDRFGGLIVSLFEMCNFHGDACFHILDEIAPLFKDEFFTKDESPR